MIFRLCNFFFVLKNGSECHVAQIDLKTCSVATDEPELPTNAEITSTGHRGHGTVVFKGSQDNSNVHCFAYQWPATNNSFYRKTGNALFKYKKQVIQMSELAPNCNFKQLFFK